MVKQPKNVSIARCVFVAGYEGGMGSRFIDPKDYNPIEDRYGNGSLFSFLVGYEENEDTSPAVINVSGVINDLPELYQLMRETELHYSSAPFYNTFWKFNVGQSLYELGNYVDYVNDNREVNMNTLKGTGRLRNLRTLQFDVVDHGSGHWGDEATYNGVAKARRGQAVYKHQNQVGVSF